jgi:hypothetical protein
LVRSNGDMQRSLRQGEKVKRPRAGVLPRGGAPSAAERQPLPMLVMMPIPNEA